MSKEAIEDAVQTDLEAAISLAEKGIPVYPAYPADTPGGKGKAPWGVTGGFKGATTDPDQIKTWWEKNPSASVAIPTGKPSGIYVLDVDSKNDHTGTIIARMKVKSKAEWIDGLFKKMPRVVTFNKGLHFYFRSQEDLPTENLAEAQRIDGKGGVIIETRAKGAAILVPPSKGYGFESGGFDSIPILTQKEIETLLSFCRSFNEVTKKPKHVTPVARIREEVATLPQLSPGDDYNARGDVEAILKKHGWTTHGDKRWTRPGKGDGCSATLNAPECPGMLYVFSSSAPPFNSNESYKPFAVYALLEHEGDFSAATKALRAGGYGGEMPTLLAGDLNNDEKETNDLEDRGDDLEKSRNKFLILPSGEVSYTESAKGIFKRLAEAKTIFNWGGRAAEIIDESKLSILRPEEFASRLEKFGRVRSWKTGKNGRPRLEMARCTTETARMLLGTTEGKSLPTIKSIVRGPLATETVSGYELLGNGWHPFSGGIYVHGSAKVNSLSVEDGVQVLDEVISDFAFVTPGDRARALAAILTHGMKAGGIFKKHCPVMVVEANASQTGKGFLCDLIFATYGETPGIVTQKTAGSVGGLDESIGQKFIDGRPFILIDNIRGRIKSDYLESALTSDGPVSVRVPHRGEVKIDPNPFSFFATSNGMVMTEDLANRCNIIRLEKRRGYSFTTYPEGDILDHIKANRTRFVSAVFAILKKYVEDGKQRTSDLRGDGRFRPWWQTVDWILQAYWQNDAIHSGHQEAQLRTSDTLLTWFRNFCVMVDKKGELGSEFSTSHLIEFCTDHEVELPDLNAENPQVSLGRKLAPLFKNGDCHKIDQWQIKRIEKMIAHESGTTKPMKFYSVEKSNIEETHQNPSGKFVNPSKTHQNPSNPTNLKLF